MDILVVEDTQAAVGSMAVENSLVGVDILAAVDIRVDSGKGNKSF